MCFISWWLIALNICYCHFGHSYVLVCEMPLNLKPILIFLQGCESSSGRLMHELCQVFVAHHFLFSTVCSEDQNIYILIRSYESLFFLFCFYFHCLVLSHFCILHDSNEFLLSVYCFRSYYTFVFYVYIYGLELIYVWYKVLEQRFILKPL